MLEWVIATVELAVDERGQCIHAFGKRGRWEYMRRCFVELSGDEFDEFVGGERDCDNCPHKTSPIDVVDVVGGGGVDESDNCDAESHEDSNY